MNSGIGLLILGADTLSQLLGDSTFSGYFSQMVDPKVVPFLFVATMMVSKLARNRTMP